MNPFLNAIQQGYSAEDILKFLSKAIPKFSQPIMQASRMGYNAKQIVGFLSKAMSPRDVRGKSESEIHEMNRIEDAQRVKHGLTLAASAVAAPIAASAASSALSRALPTGLKNLSVGMNPTNAPPNTIAGPQTAAASSSPMAPTLPQQQTMQPSQNVQSGLSSGASQSPLVQPIATNVTQPQTNAQPEIKSLNLEPLKAKYKGFFDKINDLRNSGNDTEGIAGYFRKFSPSQSEKLEKEAGGHLEEIIEKHISENPIQPVQEKKSPEMKIGDTFIDRRGEKAKITQINDKTFEFQTPTQTRSGPLSSLEYEKGTISKNETVASPQGIGEVKEVRNGQAIIDVDGKLHKVEEKNLLRPPKEAAVEALELIKSFTPEEMRSTHHMLNAYDDESNKAFFVFHNGSAYIVDDISPEEYKELSEEIEKAKTSGETVIGKWAQGEGSRGSAYNKIVKGVRDRKVVPEFKKRYKKLKVGYNLLAEWQKLLGEHERETRQK